MVAVPAFMIFCVVYTGIVLTALLVLSLVAILYLADSQESA